MRRRVECMLKTSQSFPPMLMMSRNGPVLPESAEEDRTVTARVWNGLNLVEAVC